MGRRYLLTCLLASCIALASIGGASANGSSKAPVHLYVSILDAQSSVLRYPIVNGFPASQPDLRYPGVGAPATVGADGTLYAEMKNFSSGCFSYGPIDVFAPGSMSPTRTLNLPSTGMSSITRAQAIAVDQRGFVFVAFSACRVGKRSAASSTFAAFERGVAVYAPNSAGNPFLTFRLPDHQVPMALALGRGGILYASAYENQNTGWVYAIASPRAKPTVIRTLQIGFYVGGIGLSDEPERLYVYASGPSGVPAQVQVFPSHASGHQPPSRILNLPNRWGSSVAFLGPHLFTQGRDLRAIVAFPKSAHGSVPPVFMQKLPAPSVDLSFGP